MKSRIIALFFLTLASSSNAASFDCAKAATLVEKAICSERQLSDLDDLLMLSYKKALANTPDPNSVKLEQRAWLINIRNKCQDSNCLKSVYNARLSALNNITSTSVFNKDDFINAAINGNLPAVKEFIAKGADVNAKTKEGNTVLMEVSEKGHQDIVQLLLDKGADVNAQKGGGWTALMSASMQGHTGIVQLLIAKGADVNAKTKAGNTALTYAAKQGHQDVVQILISKGAGDSTTTSIWAGKWNRGGSKFEAADMTITTKTSQAFEFSIDAINGTHTGGIEGLASSAVDFASFKDSESGCTMEFRMKNQCIDINTNECLSFGGVGVYFDGTYCKGEPQYTPSDFVAMGIFSSSSELKAFRKLVGASYNLFEDRFQMIDEGEDLDHIHAAVLSGCVRGTCGYDGCIIMHCPNGMIYAAVIDDDAIKYFSNDPLYRNKMPITIDKWKEGFDDKRVIYSGSGL